MLLTDFVDFIGNYGLIAIFIIVYLEHLNLPGFPAGIILPAVGVWAVSGNSLIIGIIISIIAALLGNITLYFLGSVCGTKVVDKYCKFFPKQRKYFDKCDVMLAKKGTSIIFFSRLIPVFRTIISVPVGINKMSLNKFLIPTTCGVVIWNTGFILCGYFGADFVISGGMI